MILISALTLVLVPPKSLSAVMRIYHLHPLERKRKGQFALDLGRRLGWRLIVIPLDDEGNRWNTTDDVNIIYKSTSAILVWEVTKHYE